MMRLWSSLEFAKNRARKAGRKAGRRDAIRLQRHQEKEARAEQIHNAWVEGCREGRLNDDQPEGGIG